MGNGKWKANHSQEMGKVQVNCNVFRMILQILAISESLVGSEGLKK